MKKTKFFVAIVVAMVAMTGCESESRLNMNSLTPEKPNAVPEYYIPASEVSVEVFASDSTSLGYANSPFGLEAQDTIKVSGTEGLRPAERLEKAAERELRFAYSGAADTTNVVKVAGLTMTFKDTDGQEYTLHCGVELQVSGEHAVVETSDDPSFYELSETVYALSYGEIVLAEAVQAFEVEEGYIPPVFDHVDWTTRHFQFQRNAGLENDTVSVLCNNFAEFAEVWSDGSRRSEETVPYLVNNLFKFNFPELNENEVKGLNGKSVEFVNGVAKINDHQVSCTWIKATVEGDVVYGSKNYAGEIEPCKVAARTITFGESSATILFYNEDKDDYAKISVNVDGTPVMEDPVYNYTEWSYRHVAFQREAQLSNNTVNVFCNNIADFVEVWSDVVNRFAISVPEIKATADDEVVGKTYDFVNGVVTVAGIRLEAQRLSAEVEGSVMYKDKDYAGEIKPCVAEARTISFTSAEKAVIRFYDEDSKDYAEAIIPATVVPYEEPVTVVDVDRDYRHDSFRSNAVVANNTISVVCDNEAVQTTTMSDGTSSKETTDYTVTNRFVYSLASMPASVKGQSFQFNGSNTVTVEGREVMVNFSAREVSAVMFNGTDYRSEAPVCAVEVSTITFQENGAVIVFTHGNETVSASIPVNYIEAEVIDGKIVGLWITDSYDLYCRYTSTDLHILAEKNGAYVAYSRNVNGKDWTVTDLSAADGQNILSSGRAMAWAQPGRIGTVSAVEASKTSTGYIITYFFPNGSPANIMGDAEAALNGTPFTDPVKATGSAENGMWTISYNGVVNYFVGTNM